MIVFKNRGTLDIRAITTLGVNAKDDTRDDVIGYFGTGLKYAIAVLLRTNHLIDIFDGTGNSYSFQPKDISVRGKDFRLVEMVDKRTGEARELGFTLDLGKNWELWQAFRELYCNAMDELDGQVEEVRLDSPDYVPDHDGVAIVVRGRRFEEVYRNRNLYILDYRNRRKVTTLEYNNIEIYEKMPTSADDMTGTIFYKGIAVGSTQSHSIYDYNFMGHMELTEDRTIKSFMADVVWGIAYGLMRSEDPDIIRKFVVQDALPKLSFESRIVFSSCYPTPSDTFLKVVGDLREEYLDVGLNPSAIEVHKQHSKVEHVLPTESIELTPVEEQQLEKAKQYCRDHLGLEIDKYKLVVANNLDRDGQVLGTADFDRSIIYLSRGCFARGTKYVLMGLVEEFTHLEHHVFDETFEQKMVYLRMIASLAEVLAGEPL